MYSGLSHIPSDILLYFYKKSENIRPKLHQMLASLHVILWIIRYFPIFSPQYLTMFIQNIMWDIKLLVCNLFCILNWTQMAFICNHINTSEQNSKWLASYLNFPQKLQIHNRKITKMFKLNASIVRKFHINITS